MLEPMTSPPANWMDLQVQDLQSHLKASMQNMPCPDETLKEAMHYSLLNGGKRLRGLLVFAVARACGVAPQLVMNCAAAIEAVHAYSLIHDDMPCMDNDVMRRGMPTCHVKFGEAMALLAGDALQTLAFEWLADNSHLSAEVKLLQLKELARAAGASGMAGGQAIDLNHVGKTMDLTKLRQMHSRKTGDLIKASVRLGYYAAAQITPEEQALLEGFADDLGLAYQVIDDILDVEEPSEVLGKTAGKDAVANKPTVVALLGLSESKALLAELTARVDSALEQFEGEQARPLKELSQRVLRRQS